MTEHLLWRVTPLRAALLQKRCPKCGDSAYENSGKFRVNANGSKLDVWLIYKCVRCRDTWNLAMYSRVAKSSIPDTIYARLQRQDASLALQVGVDPTFIGRNGGHAIANSLEFSVQGDLPTANEWAEIELTLDAPLDIPVARVVAARLCASVSEVKRRVDAGTLLASFDLRKTRVGNGLRFQLRNVVAED